MCTLVSTTSIGLLTLKEVLIDTGFFGFFLSLLLCFFANFKVFFSLIFCKILKLLLKNCSMYIYTPCISELKSFSLGCFNWLLFIWFSSRVLTNWGVDIILECLNILLRLFCQSRVISGRESLTFTILQSWPRHWHATLTLPEFIRCTVRNWGKYNYLKFIKW